MLALAGTLFFGGDLLALARTIFFGGDLLPRGEVPGDFAGNLAGDLLPRGERGDFAGDLRGDGFAATGGLAGELARRGSFCSFLAQREPSSK